MGILFWVFAVVIGLAIGRLLGGSFGSLAYVRLRGTLAIVAIALIDQYVVPVVTRGNPGFESYLPLFNVGVYLPMALLVLWNRAWLRPWPLWMLGLGLNVGVILANGGKMPSMRRNLLGVTGQHGFLDNTTVLPWLADWIPLPFGHYVSPGDVILAAALAYSLQAAMRRPSAPKLAGLALES